MIHASHWDSSLALASQGYRYISDECDKHRSNIFSGRLMLQPTIFMRGAEAARLFYSSEKLMRSTAAPRRMRKTLVGEDGVQTLDDQAHHRRKAIFLKLITPESVQKLLTWFNQAWVEALPSWQATKRINLLPELEKTLFRAACLWCGIRVSAEEANKFARQTALLISGGGSFGINYFRARMARIKLEKWIADLIEEHRYIEERTGQHTPLDIIAKYREPSEEQFLSSRVAAVEVLNIIRPIVAVARYIVFSMHACFVHLSKEDRHRLASADIIFRHAFLQEVRRYYPFFPFIAARVKAPFEWSDVKFPMGARVILDLYGTNHDALSWSDPNHFDPARFITQEIDPFSFIPQGGGDPSRGHRCPGEGITLALMDQSLDLLLNHLQYRVPEQDLRIDLRRIPTAPRSGFILEDVESLNHH